MYLVVNAFGRDVVIEEVFEYYTEANDGSMSWASVGTKDGIFAQVPVRDLRIVTN